MSTDLWLPTNADLAWLAEHDPERLEAVDALLRAELLDATADDRAPLPDSPGALAAQLTGGLELQPPHLALIDSTYRDVLAGDVDRVLITMPPQFGKSRRAARFGPLWYLQCRPDERVVVASYSAGLSVGHGRFVRQQIELHPEIGLVVSGERRAAHDWDLASGGGMLCVGVGGSLTGHPAHLLVIDDPHKGAEEADSATLRERVWAWYTSVALTRLQRRSALVLIMCMTGDTSVLMADGNERPLVEVRPGDEVATYDAGRLRSARVLNWASQGPDRVLSIRMKSGVEVRANARHPFLTVEGGIETWRRTDELRSGSVIRRVTGASGEASRVLPMGVSSPRGAGACACCTTARPVGLPESDLRPSIPRPDVPRTSSTATASPARSTTGCSPSREVSARSAAEVSTTSIAPVIGSARSALTMITAPGRCEVCSATTATSPSATAAPPASSVPPLTTWSAGEDVVVEVISTGVENVYDLQIDRTENFIANGLVSHNTRWHEDDLAGRLLAEERERWRVLDLPATAEPGDLLGRALGEPLWPERANADELAETRRRVGPRVWSALYQQHPTPPEGGIFAWADIRNHRRDSLDPATVVRSVVSIDPAGKSGPTSDETGILVLAHDRADHDHVLADLSGRYPPSDWARVALLAAVEHSATVLYEENAGADNIRQVITDAWEGLARRGEVAGLRPRIEAVSARGSKTQRAEPVASRYAEGLVHHVGRFPELEGQLTAWQLGMDSPDRMDALTQAVRFLSLQRTSGPARSASPAAISMPTGAATLMRH